MARGTKREDRSTRGRKKADGTKAEEDEHVPAMDPAVVREALGVIETGLVSACGRASQEGNIPGLIALHKHFSRIQSRGGPGGRKARGAVPASEELERLDHAFERCEAQPPP